MIAATNKANAKDLRWLLKGPSGPSRQDVWMWWHQRWLRYNRDLFLIGIVSWILVLVAGSAAVKPGEDFEEPLAMLFGPFLYGFCANLAYSAGPVVDTIFFRGAPRRGLFKAGYILSVVLTALPGAWAVSAWLITLVTGQKL